MPSTPQNQGTELLAVSVKTAAQMLELHEKTIRRLIERGQLKPHRFARVIRIPIEQINRLLNGDPIE